MTGNNLYRGAHRQNLDDNSAIDALELERANALKGSTVDDALDNAPATNPEEETFKKRYGDLRRYSAEKEKKYNDAIAALQEQLEASTRKQITLPKTEEELAQWEQDYPDVAKIMETIAMKKADERTKSIEERLKKVDERERQTAKERAELELKRLHPDYLEISMDREFHEWAAEQPAWVQDALFKNDNDARAAARAIDLYKADMGLTAAKPKKRDDSAADYVPKGSRSQVPDRDGGKKTFKESEISRLNSRQYEALEDEIMLARRENRIIYDLSGGSM